MTSLLVQTNTKDSEDFVNGDNGPENVDNSGTRDKSDGTPSGNWEKRYKDLQAFHDREVVKLKRQLEESKEKEFVLPSTVEELNEFKEKHPKLFNVIKSIAMEEGKNSTSKVRDEVDGLKRKVSKSEAVLLRERIREAHPDFSQIIASTQFNEWVDSKSARVQAWVRDNPNDAELAIAALDMYKAETGYSSEQKQPKGKSTSSDGAAQPVKTSSAPSLKGNEKIWKASEIKAMTPRQFDKYEAEIDKAMEENRIDFNS